MPELRSMAAAQEIATGRTEKAQQIAPQWYRGVSKYGFLPIDAAKWCGTIGLDVATGVAQKLINHRTPRRFHEKCFFLDHESLTIVEPKKKRGWRLTCRAAHLRRH